MTFQLIPACPGLCLTAEMAPAYSSLQQAVGRTRAAICETAIATCYILGTNVKLLRESHKVRFACPFKAFYCSLLIMTGRQIAHFEDSIDNSTRMPDMYLHTFTIVGEVGMYIFSLACM